MRLTAIRTGPPEATGTPGGGSVTQQLAEAGSATAAAVSSPADHSATCTAQSCRPGSPYSRVPSSGSTIQTRSASSRRGSSAASSLKTTSSGRSAASDVEDRLLGGGVPGVPEGAAGREPAGAQLEQRIGRRAAAAGRGHLDVGPPASVLLEGAVASLGRRGGGAPPAASVIAPK